MFLRSFQSRVAPVALVLALGLPIQGCFGKFALTTTLYDVNKNVSGNYLVQEILFLVLAVLQVYTVTGIIDAFILNLIEVITGTNPIASLQDGESTTVALRGGGRLTITRTADTFEIEQVRDGRSERWVLTEGRDGLRLTDENGEVMAGTQRLDDGSFRVVDGEGRVLAHPGRALLAQTDAMIRAGDRDGLLMLLPAETCLVR